MRRWAIASGDFTPLGGMDRANYALARHLAGDGADVHLVAHRVWPDLASLAGVTVLVGVHVHTGGGTLGRWRPDTLGLVTAASAFALVLAARRTRSQ